MTWEVYSRGFSLSWLDGGGAAPPPPPPPAATEVEWALLSRTTGNRLFAWQFSTAAGGSPPPPPASGVNWSYLSRYWARAFVWDTGGTAPTPSPSPAPTPTGGGGRRRVRARVDGLDFIGTPEQLVALLRSLAAQHAEEDEQRIEQGEKPKKRVIRIGKTAEVKEAKKAALKLPEFVQQRTGIDLSAAEAIYAAAYQASFSRAAQEQEDEEAIQAVLMLRRRRVQTIQALFDALQRLIE